MWTLNEALDWYLHDTSRWWVYIYIEHIFIWFLFFGVFLGIVEPLPAASVRPGTTYNYEWVVPKNGGPTKNDPDCITYLYYSAVDPIQDTNSGLVGPLLICKPKTLKAGKQVSTKYWLSDQKSYICACFHVSHWSHCRKMWRKNSTCLLRLLMRTGAGI